MYLNEKWYACIQMLNVELEKEEEKDDPRRIVIKSISMRFGLKPSEEQRAARALFGTPPTMYSQQVQ